MSSSGLIYAVIVGAWAAYLVPMWLRRQDELNESRPTERFSTAIRLLSGRAGMERRYAKDLRARSTEEGEHNADPDGVTDSVDVRAFAMPPTGQQARARVEPEGTARREPAAPGASTSGTPAPSRAAAGRRSAKGPPAAPEPKSARPPAGKGVPRARKASSAEAMARARRSKALARRRRTTILLFVAFTLGAIVAAVGGLAFLWAPSVPAVLLSAYIAYLRAQERKRFTYTMDRRRAEAAAQRLRERQPRRRPPADSGADESRDAPAPESDPGLSTLAADRRALVEQTDHAEWVDQQRERQCRPGHGESWDPVPVPLPTYVTAPVAPRATPSVDLGAPDAWSSARSSAAEAAAPVPGVSGAGAETDSGEAGAGAEQRAEPGDGGRSDARRAASARRSRERGRTPLFDQYEDGERPRAANE
ncbi:divisome protein SepX/GlpR [Streptomyces chiangmaiensis]|uniref:Gephyrin-like molybdotransferase receptor GlpR n=1 Tax=Streptomyces chiangmaiensis TaxID=766497 RepID=A0ABU7FHT5_9ACTN|nr:gephyrin-like molybdotransferase receptor GlpR [Streptomyces chiangmaiensis]MED7823618.1 gephyrin-like molybdotransferase receptor GlpR [Streptomyces chiangmaiensis]